METNLQIGGVYSLEESVAKSLTEPSRQMFAMVSGINPNSKKYEFVAYSLASKKEGDIHFTHVVYAPSETFGLNYVLSPFAIQQALKPLSKRDFYLFARAYETKYTLQFHKGKGIGKIEVSEKNLIESRIPHLTLRRGTKRKVV